MCQPMTGCASAAEKKKAVSLNFFCFLSCSDVLSKFLTYHQSEQC